MASTLAGLLILAMFLTTSLLTFRSTLFGDVAVSGATRDANKVMGENARTGIKIGNVDQDNTCWFSLEVENDGSTRVLDAVDMDVIVQFASGNNAAQRLTYVPSGPLAVGEWTDTALTGSFEPGIFNPGEMLTVDGKALLTEPGTATVTVGTPQGVTDSVDLVDMAPCV
ncbi:MAG: hypothetical protein O3A93_07030 [Chloroflexi bacterium]|nr:hypothetical protein [Chloroflexota bacterium]MDA1270997.1 hypothetical protein [Chloroflexota bacterium]PKB58255.1 MAG: hypothetical protein BZY83_08015 [SAR202 cluster bacterium Casp-Chloro-G2]